MLSDQKKIRRSVFQSLGIKLLNWLKNLMSTRETFVRHFHKLSFPNSRRGNIKVRSKLLLVCTYAVKETYICIIPPKTDAFLYHICLHRTVDTWYLFSFLSQDMPTFFRRRRYHQFLLLYWYVVNFMRVIFLQNRIQRE